MSLFEILGGGGISIVCLLTLIQIAPIKVNPWEKIFKLFGRWASSELMIEVNKVQDTLSELDERVDLIERDIEAREIKTIRFHLYRFADEISRGVKHSQEFFDQILDDISTYERYCKNHPDFKNDKATASMLIIKEVYMECVKNNSFLKKGD